MLVLRTSPASPFGRKVKLAAAVLGFYDRIEAQESDTNDPADTLRQQNPLGKIPILITEDGMALYDSRVAVEYLDHLAGGGKVLPQGANRFEVLQLQALADGIMDASILRTYEKRFRPEELQHAPWLEHQEGKVNRALTVLEQDPPKLGESLNAGQIALACALGYLDLRFAGEWRSNHPKLVAWLDAFADRVPEFAKTHVKP